MKNLIFKRIISLLCIATLILTTFSVVVFNVSAENNTNIVWDGSTATAFAGGTGTETDPYQITNGAELAFMLSNEGATKNKYYKIMNDIYLNDVDSSNWANKTNLNNWVEGKTFSGHLDGGSYIIYGLFYSNATNWAGLIPQLRSPDAGANGQTASIKNLGIKNAYVKAANGGIILGKVETIGTSVENCFADETVTLECTTRQGFVCYVNTNGFSMNKCYFTGVLSIAGAANNSGGGSAGLIGDLGGLADFTGVTIKNSYAITDGKEYDNRVIVKDDKVKKFAFENVFGNQFAGCHNNLTGLNLLTVDQMKGANALTNMSGLDFEKDFMAVRDGYPVLRSFYNGTSWSGQIATSFAGGTGTEADPYQITNGEELRAILYGNTTDAVNNTRNKYYILMNDIYLNDVSSGDAWNANTLTLKQWPTGDQFFMGHLDGNNHIVYGLYSNGASWAGLVPVLQAPSGYTTSIKNLGLKYSNIIAGQAGAFVGKNNSNYGTTIENCFADNTVVLKGSGMEGFVAKINNPNFVIKNCYFTGYLNGSASGANEGALIGNLSSLNADNKATNIISNCYTRAQGGQQIIGTSALAQYITYEDVYCQTNTNGSLAGLTATNSATNMTGANAFAYMPELGLDNVFMAVKGGLPVLRSFYNGIWDGKTIGLFPAVNNTEDTAYEISNGAELAGILQGGTNGRYYKLTNDIYLNDTTNPDWKNNNPNEWISGGAFYGNLDGANHIVYGIYYPDGKTGWSALIPILEPTATGACVANIGVKDSQIIGERTGGIVGKVNSSKGTVIDSCFVDETVSLKGSIAEGGIIAWISGFQNILVNNCYSKAVFGGKATTNRGGLLGHVSLDVNSLPKDEDGKLLPVNIEFRNCYAITENDIPASYSSNGAELFVTYPNSYGNVGVEDVETKLPGMNILNDITDFYGSNAYEEMEFFDFTSFVPQLNNTPVLRSFYKFARYDVDSDGSVSAADLISIRQYILKVKIEKFDFAAADVHFDGKIDSIDVVALKKALVS